MNVDEILPEIGEFGRYQKVFLFLVLAPSSFPLAFSTISQLLMITSPPQCNCTDFQTNYSNRFWESGNQCASRYEMWGAEEPGEDFVICETPLHLTLFLISLGVAPIIGSLASNEIENKFGHVKSYYILLTVNIVSGMGTALATDYWTWISWRVINQFTIPLLYLIPYVLAVEIVGAKYRADISLCINAFIVTSASIFSIFVSIFKNWRITALASSLPLFLLFLVRRYMVESPRWYLAKGKNNEALKILQKIAEVNGRTLSEDHIKKLKENVVYIQEKSQEALKYTVKDLFTKKSLTKITIFVTVSSFSSSAVGNGLLYYVYLLGGNRFVNFCLSMLVQLPAIIILWPLMNRYGRRNFICCAMIISGTACIFTQLVRDERIILVLFFIGVMGNASAILVLVLFAAELYPTPVRAIGMYFYTLTTSIGATLVPAIDFLGFESNVPLVIFGVISIIGGCSCFLLRETKDIHLPENVIEKDVSIVNHCSCFSLKKINSHLPENITEKDIVYHIT